MKNVLILMGSPRVHGNTAELCKPFIGELKRLIAEVKYLELVKLNIAPCQGCYVCQEIEGEYGCVQKDDMSGVVEQITWADVIILATPIYAWYCAAPMKTLLDRHYGLNKYYGSAEGSGQAFEPVLAEVFLDIREKVEFERRCEIFSVNSDLL